MGKPPKTSRKELRTSAPYRRARDTSPPGAAPLAKIQLVPAPAAPTPAPPTTIAPAPPPPSAPPVPPAPVAAAAAMLDLPMPVAAMPPPPAPLATAALDFLATIQTSLGFAVAALTALPHPAELMTTADPSLPEPPPGRAPAGDARSLRAGDQFALVYRHGAAIVSRRGRLGQRGAWRVVDYPSPALAAHAYALECSRLVAQGFHDVG